MASRWWSTRHRPARHSERPVKTEASPLLVAVIGLMALLAGCIDVTEGDESVRPTGPPDEPYHDTETSGSLPPADPTIDSDAPIEFRGEGLFHVRLNLEQDINTTGVSWAASSEVPWYAFMRVTEPTDRSDLCRAPTEDLRISGIHSSHSHGWSPTLGEGQWELFAYISSSGSLRVDFNETTSDEPIVINETSNDFNLTAWSTQEPGMFPGVPEPFDIDITRTFDGARTGFAVGGLWVNGGPFIDHDGIASSMVQDGRPCVSDMSEGDQITSSTGLETKVTAVLTGDGSIEFAASSSGTLRQRDGGHTAELYVVTSTQ